MGCGFPFFVYNSSAMAKSFQVKSAEIKKYYFGSDRFMATATRLRSPFSKKTFLILPLILK